MYCENCKQEVTPVKKFSVGAFLLCCLTGIGGIIYFIHYLFFKRKVCPICGGRNFTSSDGTEVQREDGLLIKSEYKESDWKDWKKVTGGINKVLLICMLVFFILSFTPLAPLGWVGLLITATWFLIDYCLKLSKYKKYWSTNIKK